MGNENFEKKDFLDSTEGSRLNMDAKKGDGFTRNHPILTAVVLTQAK